MLVFAVVISILLLCVLLVLLWIFLIKSSHSVRDEIAQITNHVNVHLEQTARLSQQAGQGTVQLMSDVYTRLGALEESSQKIFALGGEIQKLQDVLRAPKARGGLGELMLEDLLRQMIPRDRFQLQYQFRKGTRVDAVIFVSDHLVPIDSKFPLENFERLIAAQGEDEKKSMRKDFYRDVKKHINNIADRYISPEEGTFDFALMYIPSENIYYELIAGSVDGDWESMSRYALSKRVIPVSPNSFYAYLQVVLLGLRGLRMDEAAREIAESLVKLQSDFKRIEEDFGTLGTHLNHARGSYERVQRGIDHFEGKLASVERTKAIEVKDDKQVEAIKK